MRPGTSRGAGRAQPNQMLSTRSTARRLPAPVGACVRLVGLPFAVAAAAAGAAAQGITWRELDNTSHLDCAIVFDSGRGRFVAVSGGRTFEWDGVDWRLRRTPNPAPSRLDVSICYDPVGRRTLMFGGLEHVPGAVPAIVDTLWQYDGNDWSQHASVGPSPRTRHAMAFDVQRGRLVLFGGERNLLVFGDTWEWDGTAWAQSLPTASPPVRSLAAMAYHAPTGRIVLFGGADLAGLAVNDTWAWDGTNWTQLLPNTVPPARYGHRMSANPATGTLVMFGGGSATATLTDCWEWNGTDWVAGPSNPGPWRAAFGMATDSAGQTLMLGGLYVANSPTGQVELASMGDTWAWPGSGAPWVQLTPTGPPYSASPYFAYDSWRGRLVLAGGSTGTVHYTWEWDNGTWTKSNPPTALPPVFAARMVFDANRGVMVLFGGLSGLAPSGATWEWDGTTWTQRSVSGPSPRWWHHMAYDEARGEVVLFGGSGIAGDTWTYDGTAWTPRATAGPSPRYLGAMTYDAARARVVLFGGSGTSLPPFGDTWEWDGATWTQRFPAVSPAPRWSPAFCFDPVSARCVLLGGEVEIAPGVMRTVREQWFWDGTNWSGGPAAVPIDERGPAIDTLALVHHDQLQALVLLTPAFAANAGASSDLWIGSLWVATATSGGVGCAGATAPRLDAFGVPVVGDGRFGFDLTDAPPNGFAVVGGSLAAGSLPLGGGCTLYLHGALVTVAVAANAAGFANLAFPIPNTPSLIGFEMTAQAATLDAAAPLGVALSGYVAMRVGS